MSALRVRTVDDEPLVAPDGGAWLDLGESDLGFLLSYSDDFLACRGDHHQFPQLNPRRKISSKYMRHHIVPDTMGVVYIEQNCMACGRVRWRITGPGGMYEAGTRWQYRQPKGYKAPKGTKLTRAHFAAELYRRVIEGWATA